MAFKKFNKVFSVILSLAIFCSVCAVNGTYGLQASASKSCVFTSEDFSSSTSVNESMELKGSNKIPGDYINSKTFTIDDTPDASLTVKDSCWGDNNKTTHISFDYILKNGNKHYIWFATDKNNGIGIYLNNQDGGLMSKLVQMKNKTIGASGIGDNEGKLICATKGWCNSGNYAKASAINSTIHIDANLIYDSANKNITVSVTLGVQTLDIAATTTAAAIPSYYFNSPKFTQTVSYDSNIDSAMKPMFDADYGFTVDNILVDSYASIYDNFYNKNSTLLDKNPTEVTQMDIDEYVSLNNDISSFSNELKSYFIAQNDNIIEIGKALEKFIPDFKSDDFSNAWYSSKYWTGNPQIYDDNGVKYITATSDVTLSENYWIKNSRPKAASITFEGTGYIYFIYDKDSQNGCGLYLENTNQGTNAKQSQVTEGKYTNDGGASAYAVFGPYISKGADNEEIRKAGYNTKDYWTTIDMAFDYSQFDRGIIMITYSTKAVRKSDGQTVLIPAVTHTFKFNNYQNFMNDFRLHIKPDNTFKISKFSYTPDYAELFAIKYTTILNKNSIEDLDNDERAIIDVAKAEYLSYDDSVKQQLIANGIASKLAKFLSKNANTDKFENDFSDILALKVDTIKPSDSNRLQQAENAYYNLSKEDQLILINAKILFNSLDEGLKNYIEPRKDGDLSDFVEDFESDLLKWDLQEQKNVEGSVSNNIKIVQDPLDANNNVLQVDTNGFFLVPKNIIWPNNATMTKASFRMKFTSSNPEGNPFCKNVFQYSFVDLDNYSSAAINAAGTMICSNGFNDSEKEYQDWVGDGSLCRDDNGTNADLMNKWIDVSIYYSANGKAIINYKDAKDNILNGSLNLNYLNGKISFGAPFGAYGNHMPKYYVDDIKVSFTKGDYDVNSAPEDIQVYYSGNTQLKPGDTVLISGENLYNTVSNVSIMQLDNTPHPSSASFISEMGFDTLGQNGGCTPVWSDLKAVNANVIQWTATSLKVIIPDNYTQGVYALKLYAKIPGHDDKIIYINNPDINVALGNEGEVFEPGSIARVSGSNISLDKDASKVTVALVDDDKTVTMINNVEVDNEYALKFVMPDRIKSEKRYQLMVHNGFGDETAWSQPTTIYVGKSEHSKWSNKIFNVKDYGALGDSTNNDTPAVISALSAAASNGGGIVYFPMGIYRLVTTIVIPENIVIKGEGIDRTRIIWTPKKWMPGDAPDTLISATKNLEICNIAFYTTRRKNWFTFYVTDEIKNIYIHDVRFQNSFMAGAATEGDATNIPKTSNPIVYMTPAEIQTCIKAECDKGYWLKSNGIIENIQMYNIENLTDVGNIIGRGVHMHVSHAYIDNFELKNMGWSSIGCYTESIVQNCDMIGAAVYGKMYCANNYYMGGLTNNHEVFTTDGTQYLANATVQFIGDKPDILAQYGITQTDNVTYRFLFNKYGKDQLKGKEIYVVTGQGVGQTRVITYNNEYIFKVESQFAVVPNRNSKIDIQFARSNQYFINNTFENGGASGTYGCMINSVFDNNLFVRHGGQIFNTHSGETWYITIKDNTLKDPFYMHGDGIGATTQVQTDIGHWQFLLLHGTHSLSSLGFVFKGNKMLDGSYMLVNVPNLNYLRDFIIENNYIGPEAYTGIFFNAGNGADGVLLRNNIYDCTNKYDNNLNSYLTSNSYTNRVGEKRYLSLEEYGIIKGDVNRDGKVSLKDATMIRYYVLEQISLSKDQIECADVDSDGECTINDANLIRKSLV